MSSSFEEQSLNTYETLQYNKILYNTRHFKI